MKQTYEALSATLDVLLEDQLVTREHGGTEEQWKASQAKVQEAIVAAGWTEDEHWDEMHRRLDLILP